MNYLGLNKFKLVKGSSVDGFVSTGQDLLKRAVEVLIQTQKGTRIYDPNYGTNLQMMLFNIDDKFSRIKIEEDIKDAIATYEPRVMVSDLQIFSGHATEDAVYVFMTLYYLDYNTKEILELSVTNTNIWKSTGDTSKVIVS